MRILLLPLDERPCNYIYPQMVASSNHSVHLTMPPLDILPKKKISASFNKIRQYLLKEAVQSGCISYFTRYASLWRITSFKTASSYRGCSRRTSRCSSRN